MARKYYDKNIGEIFDTPPDDGFGLFARVVGGFALGSLALALMLTLGTSQPESDAEDTAFRMAICCDIGGTAVGMCILAAALGAIISRSQVPLRSRGLTLAAITGIMYQAIPVGLAFLWPHLGAGPMAEWALTGAEWLYRAVFPAIAPFWLVRRSEI